MALLPRKDIMRIGDKDRAFREIARHDDWSKHRQAAERFAWKKKNQPDTIVRCPNRGRRHNHAAAVVHDDNDLVHEEEEEGPCGICGKPPDGYDLPCRHPVCHPCFITTLKQNHGQISCPTCPQTFTYDLDN